MSEWDSEELQSALREGLRHRLKARLVAKEQQQRRRRLLRPWFGVAAAAAVLLIVWWVWPRSGANPDQLFAQYFTPLPNVIAPLVRDPGKDSTNLTKALAYYDQGQYEEAITHFEQMAPTERVPGVALYQGICHLYLEDYSAAAEELISVEGNYRLSAQWYLALLRLRTGEREQCIAILSDIIATTGHPFSNQARRLLRQIQ